MIKIRLSQLLKKKLNLWRCEIKSHDEITETELRDLIRLSKKILWSSADVRKKIQQNGVNITPANFYSNIPLVEDIHNSFEYLTEDEVYNGGIFDKAKVNDFMESIYSYSLEFNPPLDGDVNNPNGFFWNNPAFSYSDAMSYYCVLRHFKPKKLLEIGAGFSTLIANEALIKNGFGEITMIEPYPKKFLRELESVGNIIEQFVQDISVPDMVSIVEKSDVWFIDSTHTVKIGSDCLYIYLKVMPEVKTDVIVHTHDVFLPYGMPKEQALDKHIYWTEQYLLYAYMLDNPKIEILFGSAFVNNVMPKEINKLMNEKYPGGGGSIWYRLNGKKI